MPEPAAELVVYHYGSKEHSEIVDRVVSECGFRSSKVDGSVIETAEYTAYHYEPFEVREENVELLDTCAEELRQTFPEMEVWIRNKVNKDYGSPISEDFLIYIAPSRDEVENSRTSRYDQVRRADAGEGSPGDQERFSEIAWRSEDNDL